MRLILLQTVPKLGQAGKVVDVADGFARNYLLPRKLAAPASANRLQEQSRKQADSATHATTVAKRNGKRLAELRKKKIVIKRKANEKGTLFAAVTATEVAKAIGFSDARDIASVSLAQPIKSIGEHRVKVALTGVEAVELTIVLTQE